MKLNYVFNTGYLPPETRVGTGKKAIAFFRRFSGNALVIFEMLQV